tara:strand:+ start:450 stop:629 length:180 start_codon:yes stop_codon:yes gene_type:complete
VIKITFFAFTEFGRYPLERIPKYVIAARDFVNGKVAFEHTALCSEFLYTEIKIRRRSYR